MHWNVYVKEEHLKMDWDVMWNAETSPVEFQE